MRPEDRTNPPAATGVADYLHRVFRATGLLLAAIVVINGAVFAYLFWRVGPEMDTAVDGARAVRELHESMLDQETGLRGFLLTGDADFLTPYEEGVAAMDVALVDAEERLASDPQFSGDLLAMRLAQQAWVDQWADQAAQAPTFASDATLRGFLEEGKSVFDAYRTAQERLIRNLVAERTRLMDRQRAVIAAAGAGALVMGLALLGIAARERRRLVALVIHPIDDLRATMGRLEHGDLEARAAGSGAAEFAQLATSLDTMATRLASSLQLGRDQSAALRARSDRQAEILTMARDVAGSLNLTYVLRSVAEHGHRLAGADQVAVWLFDDDGTTLREARRYSTSGPVPSDADLELGQGLVGEVARDGRSKTSDALGTPAVTVELTEAVSALAVPMIVGARVVGVLDARFTEPAVLDPDMVPMMEALAAHGGTAIEAARLHETTEELSQIDALTRLYNRRRLDADLATELARADRYNRPLAFVMADVDNFKAFNDTFGHQRGDEVLQEIARMLTTAVRASDTVYRYGGEELSILLRETDENAAVELTERLRTSVEQHFATRPGLPGVTVSFGVAARRDGPTAADALVHAADEALYTAKRSGRNRVALASTAPSSE